MATFNDMDFGSDSEEGDFNPAPHIPSDDEDAAEPQASRSKSKPSKRASPSANGGIGGYDEDDDNIRNGDTELDDQANGDEDDDEDEDEEDAVSVGCLGQSLPAQLTFDRVVPGKESAAISETNSSI